METGYVIVHTLPDKTVEFYRGCARGRSDHWAKTLAGAQIYASAKVAMYTMRSDKFNRVREECSVKQIRFEMVED